MGLLSLSNLKKGKILCMVLKVRVSKIDLGLLNAYKMIILIEISMEIRMINFWIMINVSCVLNEETYFRRTSIF